MRLRPSLIGEVAGFIAVDGTAAAGVTGAGAVAGLLRLA
jgi:hypothetical protein